MKPDYYVRQRTREVVETTRDGDNYSHKRVKRTRGEHVMTYRVWTTLKPHQVAKLIGGLAKDKKTS